MARKNLLADSDYTTGKDNRFHNSVVIARVSKIECDATRADIRATIPDKVDRNGEPLTTKPIPVLQTSAGKKRSFAMPRVGQNTLLVKLPNGTGDYVSVGHFYTTSDPPPVTDPMLDHTIYDDGSIIEFNASTGSLKWDFKGGANLKTQQPIIIEVTNGDITIKSSANVNIEAPTQIYLKGPMKFEGDITHIGNMNTSGTHTDSIGHHTAAAFTRELLERIEVLERRVAALEARR